MPKACAHLCRAFRHRCKYESKAFILPRKLIYIRSERTSLDLAMNFVIASGSSGLFASSARS